MSRRRLDMQAESELARFLDVCFYSRLIDSGELSSAQRITDIEMQREGIDVIAKKNGWQALIDEKAQLYYINNVLPTFAFELGFLLDGHETIGWFLNEELHTDRYFLLWPNATTSDLEHLTAKDFTLVYGLMIKKKSIQQYLQNLGLSKEHLLKRLHQLRADGDIGKHPSGNSGVYFYVSDPSQYSESPINLVISKKILKSIASAAYNIKPDALERLI